MMTISREPVNYIPSVTGGRQALGSRIKIELDSMSRLLVQIIIFDAPQQWLGHKAIGAMRPKDSFPTPLLRLPSPINLIADGKSSSLFADSVRSTF
jgi:hypothetical protein